ncbi:MAG: hypothetical protein QOC89_1185 [Paraburkholderia sp.]|nr:hypothetical protein [Paraburkholderia sp.]
MEQLISHPVAFLIVSFAAMTFAGWVGFAVLRRKNPLDEHLRDDFGVVQSATLTLLALVIGFSLSMAVSRYDQRKNCEEEEANAIGTEYLRADLLPVADAAIVRRLLPKYLEQRIRFYQERDPQQQALIDAATTKLENDLWAGVRTSAAAQPNPVTALAVAGMNDVINTQGYTQAAWWNRIPEAAWSLMILLGVFCNLLVGYGSRSPTLKMRFLFILPATISVSFMLIADIDSPRNGTIRVVPKNLMSVARSMETQAQGNP